MLISSYFNLHADIKLFQFTKMRLHEKSYRAISSRACALGLVFHYTDVMFHALQLVCMYARAAGVCSVYICR